MQSEVVHGHGLAVDEPDDPTAQRRVLVIDDDRGVAQVLAIRLRSAGYATTIAHDGASGLEAAEMELPDAILLDMRMPGLDGLETNARLKHHERLRDIPVVFLSANVQDSARHAAFAAGAAAYLVKPYEPSEVLEAIANALDARARTPVNHRSVQRTAESTAESTTARFEAKEVSHESS
jgi:CheY-like chemotaxis protein